MAKILRSKKNFEPTSRPCLLPPWRPETGIFFDAASWENFEEQQTNALEKMYELVHPSQRDFSPERHTEIEIDHLKGVQEGRIMMNGFLGQGDVLLPQH